MTTVDFIIQLFCRIDDLMPDAEKHSQAKLYPSEVVTLAILFALKVLAIAPSIVGWYAIIMLSFQSCPFVLACFDCSILTVSGPRCSWQNTV